MMCDGGWVVGFGCVVDVLVWLFGVLWFTIAG